MYVLRRLSLLPISLLFLSIICFGLRQLSPGDPVVNAMGTPDARLAGTDPAAFDRQYRRVATTLGYDQPAFYLSVFNAALPDTLHRITRADERRALRNLTLQTGNWPAVQRYYRSLHDHLRAGPSADGGMGKGRIIARRLLTESDTATIEKSIVQLGADGSAVASAYEHLLATTERRALLLPRIIWNGTGNQYHRWLTGVTVGEWGISQVTGQPVLNEVRVALPRTLLMNLLAFTVVFLVSIPLGLYLADGQGQWWARLTNLLLFVLYGVPSFWVATLLANFLTTPAYGLDLFPSMGFGEVPPDANWWVYVSTKASHLLLPVLCLAYPSWAYVTRQLRSAAITEGQKAYVTTARMKGLSRSAVLFGHVLPGASFH